MRHAHVAVVVLLAGVPGAIVVLTADLLLGPRFGSPPWTCVSTGPATTANVQPRAGDASMMSMEQLQRYSESTDRAGTPLALVAFIRAPR